MVEPAQKLCRCDNRPCLVFCPPTPVQRFTLLYPLIFSLGDGIPSWHSHFPATSFQQLQMPKLTGIVFWEQKCLREFRVKQPVKILTLAHEPAGSSLQQSVYSSNQTFWHHESRLRRSAFVRHDPSALTSRRRISRSCRRVWGSPTVPLSFNSFSTLPWVSTHGPLHLVSFSKKRGLRLCLYLTPVFAKKRVIFLGAIPALPALKPQLGTILQNMQHFCFNVFDKVSISCLGHLTAPNLLQWLEMTNLASKIVPACATRF